MIEMVKNGRISADRTKNIAY